MGWNQLTQVFLRIGQSPLLHFDRCQIVVYLR
jgi:hypothetical protein